MKKIFILMTLMLTVLIVNPVCAKEEKMKNVVYLGVEDYNQLEAEKKDDFKYNFFVDGERVTYPVSTAEEYKIKNILAQGYVYDIEVKDGVVVKAEEKTPTAWGKVESYETGKITLKGKTYHIKEGVKFYEISAEVGGAKVEGTSIKAGDSVKIYGDTVEAVYKTFLREEYKAPVKGTPGLKTIKNFLMTAFEPVGTTNYIYGGGWDWQDVGSSNMAKSIGISDKWVDFFQRNNVNYTYENEDDEGKSYYPHRAYNEYYYAGLDCSGYVGWAVYNTFNTENGKDGYVQSSRKMATTFANKYGYGTFTDEIKVEEFKPGDVFSMGGHVWICVGKCDDGSLVILHSTPSASYSEKSGGGVQLSALGEDEHCEAFALASKYMDKFYPLWSTRYHAVLRSYESYTNISREGVGKFSWHISDKGLLDPDGYRDMSAAEVLENIFGE
ncbi:MAG: copper amine oxidase N-terminal domain-containing protein [Peptoniphilus sp.]|nr:copper amine oxidase N-terminal domain-containing protein [Peptoniphilus sp.]